MIEQFRPPTDSLYKFIAITGVALTLFVGWSLVQTEVQTYKLRREMNASVQSLVRAESSKFAEGFMTLADDVESGTVSPGVEVGKRIDTIMESKPDNFDELEESAMKAAWDLGIHQRETNPERTLQLFAAVVGTIIAISGFVLWWRRVQKPLDELLQLQLEKARKESFAEQNA